MLINKETEIYIQQFIDSFLCNPSDIIFDNIIYPDNNNKHQPAVFIWSPCYRYAINVDCPIHKTVLQPKFFTNSSCVSKSRNPRLIYGLHENILLIQQIYICKEYNHSYFSAAPFLLDKGCSRQEFPFILYAKTSYTQELISYLFLQIVQGVSFNQISEGIGSLHFDHYLKLNKDGTIELFSKNELYQYPSKNGLKDVFIDMFYRSKENFISHFSIPTSAISVDHTFRVGKDIGGYRKSDGKFVSNYLKLYIILDEEGYVVDFQLTETTSIEEVDAVIKKLKLKLDSCSRVLKTIYSDNCCKAQSVYKKIFPSTEIKLDLFHAVQRFTSILPAKKSPKTIKISQEYGLVFREDGDVGTSRGKYTPSVDKILKNLDIFLTSNSEYFSTLSNSQNQDVLKAIENIKFHINKGCLSDIKPGGGTNNNERIHRYLNRSFLRGTNSIGPELANAVLHVIFYAYNFRLKNKKHGHAVFIPFKFTPNPLAEKAPQHERFEDLETNISNMNNDDFIRSDDSCSVVNSLLSNLLKVIPVVSQLQESCHRKKVKVENEIGFGICVDDFNKSDQQLITTFQLDRNLALFDLKRVDGEHDRDCLFRSILMQLNRLSIIDSDFSHHLMTIGLDCNDMVTSQNILILRKKCVEEVKMNKRYEKFMVHGSLETIDIFEQQGIFTDSPGDFMVDACSDVLHTPIVVISSAKVHYVTIHSSSHDQFEKICLFIAFNHFGPGHYESTTQLIDITLKGQAPGCFCRINPSCESDSRCPCIELKQYCMKSCKCRHCSNQDPLYFEDSTDISCSCGSKTIDDHFIACIDVAGRKRTRCPCFKAGKSCDDNCKCKRCSNTQIKQTVDIVNETKDESFGNPKLSVAGNKKIFHLQSAENYLEQIGKTLPSSSWTMIESMLLKLCIDKLAEEEECLTSDIHKVFNKVANSKEAKKCGVSIRSKSEKQIVSKMHHLDSF